MEKAGASDDCEEFFGPQPEVLEVQGRLARARCVALSFRFGLRTP